VDKLESLDAQPGTLGGVLYAGNARYSPAESEWVGLVRAVANQDEAALHALYDRAHRLVFTLAVRITCNRESGEEVTLDVFHDVWRHANRYDPDDGTVLGWIMNQARSRSIDRLRHDKRLKRVDPGADVDADLAYAVDAGDALELRQQGAQLRSALATLSTDERRAIESAFFADLTHAEIAQRWDEPLGTVKTRIRTGLRKLRRIIEAEDEKS
jgi:RNA polymerase sigma-70 factor (ECF subfamily)